MIPLNTDTFWYNYRSIREKMQYDIVAPGFMVVEIMRKERGEPFWVPGVFLGPYPSEDVCIMLDVAAKLGKKCCLMGPCGDDPFSRVTKTRLCNDGVDMSFLRVLKGENTPVVFVRYNEDGSREYLDFIRHAPSAALSEEDVHPEILEAARWVHFSGELISFCSKGKMLRGIEKMLAAVPAKAMVSLDPNFIMRTKKLPDYFFPFIERADLILPSEGEAAVLAGTASDQDACAILAKKGKIAVLKRGRRGCTVYRGDEVISVPAFAVDEVDPTGCGDSFCAGFIYGLLEGWPLERVGRFSNAVGALQAMAFGPMEGARTLAEVESFIRKNSNKDNEYGY
jgi:fructokinase